MPDGPFQAAVGQKLVIFFYYVLTDFLVSM